MTEPFYPIFVIALTEADGGGYLGFAPDLTGCQSDGATPEEALRNAQAAVEEWLADAREDGAEIPLPHSAERQARAHTARIKEEFEALRARLDTIDDDIADIRQRLDLLVAEADAETWPDFT